MMHSVSSTLTLAEVLRQRSQKPQSKEQKDKILASLRALSIDISSNDPDANPGSWRYEERHGIVPREYHGFAKIPDDAPRPMLASEDARSENEIFVANVISGITSPHYQMNDSEVQKLIELHDKILKNDEPISGPDIDIDDQDQVCTAMRLVDENIMNWRCCKSFTWVNCSCT